MLLVLAAGIWVGNNRLSVSRYTVEVSGLDPALEGLTVVQISDLHSKWFGADQNRLAAKVQFLDPDIILCTGDMTDSRRYDEAPELALVGKLTALAPTYMVSGNHEWWSAGRYERLIPRLEALGATVLENDTAYFARDGATLKIAGVTDESRTEAEAFYKIQGEGNPGEPVDVNLSEDTRSAYLDAILPGLIGEDEPVLLMAHRPEFFSQYAEYGAGVVFSGHAHGGQVRLPFIGGMVAPGQGLFPAYDAGMYKMGDTAMVVSRGLGNSIFPVRVFNPPDVVLVTLTGKPR